MFELADEEDMFEEIGSPDEDAVSAGDSFDGLDPYGVLDAMYDDMMRDPEPPDYDYTGLLTDDADSDARSDIEDMGEQPGCEFGEYRPAIQLGTISQELPLPNELLLQIVDHLAQREILSIARLSLACRRWYQVIRDDRSWEKRTKDLGGLLLPGTSWLFSWRLRYCTVCRDCKDGEAAVDTDLTVDAVRKRTQGAFSRLTCWPYILSEPRSIKVCFNCGSSYGLRLHLHSSRSIDWELSSAEVDALAITRPRIGRFWFERDIQAYKRAKSQKRTAELTALVSTLPETERSDLYLLLFNTEGRLPATGYPSCVDKAVSAVWQSVDAPSQETIEGIARLQRRYQAMGKEVLQVVRRRPDLNEATIGPLVERGLGWLCGDSKANSEGNRTGMATWRSELAEGKQKVDRFLLEVSQPTISHSADNCKGGCGRTPALACTQAKCARCCSGISCARHASNTSYKPPTHCYERSFRDEWDEDEWGHDVDSDDLF